MTRNLELTDPPPARSVAFVFPGQGSQYVGMGAELVERSPAAAAAYARADAALGIPLSKMILEGPAEELDLHGQRPAGDPRHQRRVPRGHARGGSHGRHRDRAPGRGRALRRPVRGRRRRQRHRLRRRAAPRARARPDHAGARHRGRHGRRHRPERRAGPRDRRCRARARRDLRRQRERAGPDRPLRA